MQSPLGGVQVRRRVQGLEGGHGERSGQLFGGQGLGDAVRGVLYVPGAYCFQPDERVVRRTDLNSQVTSPADLLKDPFVLQR